MSNPKRTKRKSDDDDLKVIICGTSGEGTITDFIQEQNVAWVTTGGEKIPDVSKPITNNNNNKTDDPSYSQNQDIDNVLDFFDSKSSYQRYSIDATKGVPPSSTPSSSASTFPPSSYHHRPGNITYTPSTNQTSSSHAGASSSESSDTNLIKERATKKKKVLMEWEVSGNRKWVYTRDRSHWFNYGLDENTFKEWIQKQLDKRLEALTRQSIVLQDGWEDTSSSLSSSTQPNRHSHHHHSTSLSSIERKSTNHHYKKSSSERFSSRNP